MFQHYALSSYALTCALVTPAADPDCEAEANGAAETLGRGEFARRWGRFRKPGENIKEIQ